ncbi:MAG: ABC transporter permease [Thermoleophilia bacterium]|nr:ABC transporter permease [Thermoleophilia bacterium]
MNALAVIGGSFVREQLRIPLNVALLVLIPAFFVLVFASVLGDFSKALGGDLVEQAATAISAGWAAAFLCGALSFFQLNSSRGADRRLASAGLGAGRVSLARIGSALVLGLLVSFAAFVTLFLRTGIEHPAQALLAIFTFAAIYIGIGALIGALVRGALEGSLLVILVFSLDVFSGPAMTSGGGLSEFTPTRDAASLLVAAGGGQVSPTSDWLGAAALALGALVVAYGAFWFSARSRA